MADRKTKARRPDGFGVKVGKLALERGLLCRFDPHWLAFGPPLVVTAEQIDEMVSILEGCLQDALNP